VQGPNRIGTGERALTLPGSPFRFDLREHGTCRTRGTTNTQKVVRQAGTERPKLLRQTRFLLGCLVDQRLECSQL